MNVVSLINQLAFFAIDVGDRGGGGGNSSKSGRGSSGGCICFIGHKILLSVNEDNKDADQ